MGSHLPRQKPDLGDFKSPRDERKTPARPRDPKPATKEAAESVVVADESTGATPFQLSRIYAKGWQAGMNSASDEPEFDSAATAEALNPCEATAERERWAQGFSEAVARKLGAPGRKAIPFRLSTV